MWTWAETRLNKDGREKFAAACPLNFCRLDIRWHRGSFSPRLTSRRFDSSRRASTAARLHLPECKAAAACSAPAPVWPRKAPATPLQKHAHPPKASSCPPKNRTVPQTPNSISHAHAASNRLLNFDGRSQRRSIWLHMDEIAVYNGSHSAGQTEIPAQLSQRGEDMKATRVAVTLAFCLLAAGVCFAQNPFMGTWKLNDAK